MILYPYGTLVTGGIVTSVVVGNLKSKDGNFNYGASTTVGLVSTGSSVAANTIMDLKYQNTIDKYSVETTSAYVQQLSDEELESALMQFDLLEKEDQNDVKVL